jgi:hypothetical protein
MRHGDAYWGYWLLKRPSVVTAPSEKGGLEASTPVVICLTALEGGSVVADDGMRRSDRSELWQQPER